MSTSSAGSQKRLIGRKEPTHRQISRNLAELKKGVAEYSRTRDERYAKSHPSTLTITRIVKTPLTTDANATQQTPQNDV